MKARSEHLRYLGYIWLWMCFNGIALFKYKHEFSTSTAGRISRAILYNIHTFVVKLNFIYPCMNLAFCCLVRVMSKAQHFPRPAAFFDVPPFSSSCVPSLLIFLSRFNSFLFLAPYTTCFACRLSCTFFLTFPMVFSQFCRTYDVDTTHGIPRYFTSGTGYRVVRRYLRYR